MAKRKRPARTGARVTWEAMRQRCLYPKHNSYRWYGARGIGVCEEWSTFNNFLRDMGERPEGRSLDRIDPDKDYSKDNCRWATWDEQRANRRPNGYYKRGTA